MTDNVNHPAHYETGKFECIEVMLETQGVEAVLNFCQCNAFKYLYRAKRNYQHPVIAETLGGEEIRDDSKWEYATDTLLKGHGDKSVMVLAQYFKLTEEEIMCIRYHMGAFCDKSEWNDYTRAVHKYTNVLWTHQADMLASHVEGV